MQGYVAHQQQRQLRIAHNQQRRSESEGTMRRIQEESNNSTSSSSLEEGSGHIYNYTTQQMAGFRL